MKNQIYPCLWFDNQAAEAAEFYCSVFDNATIKDDTGLVVTFEASGQLFMCLNGGPHYKLNPSISFFVTCETESEIDGIWKQLSDGGSALMPLDKYDWSPKYGWIQDRYGVSWQLSLGKMEDAGHKFACCLLFTGDRQGNAEKAVHFYTSLFDDTEVIQIVKYTKNENQPEGTVKHARFNIGEAAFITMDSSLDHGFGFNEAFSFVVECDTQEEIDFYWDKLSAVPEAEQCGWLKDRFGVSWQIVPSVLKKLMADPDRAPRVTDAFMKMKKFDIGQILNA